MKAPTLLLPIALLLGACAASSAPAQTLLLNYTFDGSAANSGSAADAGLSYYLGATLSAAGAGVSGAPGDSALNNSAATGMGTLGNSAAGASTSSKSVNLGTLGSFTIAGWYNAQTTPGGNAKLFELSYGTNSAISLIAESSERLALNIGGSSSGKNSTPQTAYGSTGTWIFFAVTYDGTTSSNNLNFYIGNASSFSAAGTRSITGTDIAFGSTVGVGVGNGYYNNGSANRPFDGLVDEISFYGAGAGSAAGVLSLAQLDALRLATLSGIPEPSSAAALFGGIGLAFAALRRRARRA